MRKCFIFDIDGTLYNRKFHEVDVKTIEALSILKKNGNIIGLATSRCVSELKHLPSCIREFPFDFKIVDGGAITINNKNEIISKYVLDKNILKSFDIYCKEEGLTYRYCNEFGNYWGVPVDLFWHQLWHDLYLITPVYKSYENDEVTNLMVRFKNEEHENKIKELAKNCGLARYYDCYEIRSSGINKSIAIQKIVEEFKISEVYCFGDGHNDLEMLQQAHVGIAMGNACKELKELADIVIDTIDNDGIYKYLKENKMLEEV